MIRQLPSNHASEGPSAGHTRSKVRIYRPFEPFVFKGAKRLYKLTCPPCLSFFLLQSESLIDNKISFLSLLREQQSHVTGPRVI